MTTTSFVVEDNKEESDNEDNVEDVKEEMTAVVARSPVMTTTMIE